MRVGYVQYDVAHNIRQNMDYIARCLQKETCDIFLLPELAVCGYLFESRQQLLDCAEVVPAGWSTQRMIALSEQYACTIIFGLAEKDDGDLFNMAVIVSKGKYIGKYRKIHLSDFEKKYFSRGTQNQIFDIDGVRIGVQICFDLWFPEISREQIRMGADLLCVLANFGGETTYHISKIRAIENLTPLVLCNRVGEESIPGMDAEFLGKSTVVDPSGKRVCDAPVKEVCFGSYDIAVTGKKANVICSDFDREIALHY